MSTGEELKQEGIELARTAHKEWQERFRAEVRVAAKSGVPFTSEDIIEIVGLPSGDTGTNKNNCVGASMAGISQSGLITKTGVRVKSKRASMHASESNQWIGAWKKTVDIRNKNSLENNSCRRLIKEISAIHKMSETSICEQCLESWPCATITVVRRF